MSHITASYKCLTFGIYPEFIEYVLSQQLSPVGLGKNHNESIRIVHYQTLIFCPKKFKTEVCEHFTKWQKRFRETDYLPKVLEIAKEQVGKRK